MRFFVFAAIPVLLAAGSVAQEETEKHQPTPEELRKMRLEEALQGPGDTVPMLGAVFLAVELSPRFVLAGQPLTAIVTRKAPAANLPGNVAPPGTGLLPPQGLTLVLPDGNLKPLDPSFGRKPEISKIEMGQWVVQKSFDIGPAVSDAPSGTLTAMWQWQGFTGAPGRATVLQEWKDFDAEKADLEQLKKAATLVETDQGSMLLEFFPEKAPNTVRNFLKLASKKFYDNLVFHRIMKGFMVQGGCPRGDGTGDPGYRIKAEFNDTPHKRGVISMARGKDPDSGGSQFFIVDSDHVKSLDGQYTAFGRLLDGYDVLEKIANLPVGPDARRGNEPSVPAEPPAIKRVLVVEKPGAAPPLPAPQAPAPEEAPPVDPQRPVRRRPPDR